MNKFAIAIAATLLAAAPSAAMAQNSMLRHNVTNQMMGGHVKATLNSTCPRLHAWGRYVNADKNAVHPARECMDVDAAAGNHPVVGDTHVFVKTEDGSGTS